MGSGVFDEVWPLARADGVERVSRKYLLRFYCASENYCMQMFRLKHCEENLKISFMYVMARAGQYHRRKEHQIIRLLFLQAPEKFVLLTTSVGLARNFLVEENLIQIDC